MTVLGDSSSFWPKSGFNRPQPRTTPASPHTYDYRFLDTLEDRRLLVDDVRRLRAAMLDVVCALPGELHERPRYHGWSAAALLAHLDQADRFALNLIELAQVGITPAFSLRLLDSVNTMLARLHRRESVRTIMSRMAVQEYRILHLILNLPINRFSKQVYHASSGGFLTIEQSLQAFFFYHWREHLETVAHVDGVALPPFHLSDWY